MNWRAAEDEIRKEERETIHMKHAGREGGRAQARVSESWRQAVDMEMLKVIIKPLVLESGR